MFSFFKKPKKDVANDEQSAKNNRDHGEGAHAPPTPSSAVSRDAPSETSETMHQVKRSSNVKPCGHGTVAVAPRPPPAPPGSPVLRSRNNSDGAISVKPERPSRKSSLQDKPPANGIIPDKKNLINQEAKFQSQLNELSKQLSQRDAEANKLRFQMEELQRDVFTKSAGMDRLHAELQAAHKESEYVKQKLRNLESDLQEFRTKNALLTEELAGKAESFSKNESEATTKINELESTITEIKTNIITLEAQIDELKQEKQQLEERHKIMMEEKEEEKKKVEEALEVALKDKEEVNKKWEQEFEKLRTVSILKEQQMLDDFEWKLREVEKTCKKKLMEKDRNLDDRLRDACKEAEEKVKLAQDMMIEVQHLKQCQNEIDDLKGRSKAQEKNMDVLKEQQEQMKMVETSLKDETKKLRNLIEMEKENLQHMQRMHHQEIVDKERWLHQTLEEKKTEIAMYWEEKLLHEIGRLKYELEQLYVEEKHSAIEDVRRQKQEEFDGMKKSWERKIEECMKEITILKRTLEEKERYYHKELIEQQTITDRDILELRRIMDKIDNAHHERFEKLVNDHEKEIDKMVEENATKLREVEDTYQTQLATLRLSLDSVKEQMEHESQEKIQNLIQQHRSELDTQWANLVHQKSEAVKLVENEYINKYQTLEEQFYTQQRSHEAREIELLKTIDSLKNDLESKTSTVDDLQNNVDTLEGGVQVLHQEIAHQGEQLMKNRRDADQKIRGLQDILMKLQALQEQERGEFQNKLAQQHKQSQATVDHLTRKCATLTKLFEEIRSRYERRESREEDLNTIADLKHVISEQEKDMACMNEEKRYYQMQLIKLQRNPYDDEEEEFVDSEEYVVAKEENNGIYNRAPPITSTVSIPPTIQECDDSEEDDDDDGRDD